MITVEQFLKWKVLPRCMMLASTVMSWRCAEWFMELDAPTASQSAFVSVGCESNLQYGLNGVCEPSGQMPGFGPNATELEGSMLSLEQIAAIVEYERGLE